MAILCTRLSPDKSLVTEMTILFKFFFKNNEYSGQIFQVDSLTLRQFVPPGFFQDKSAYKHDGQ